MKKQAAPRSPTGRVLIQTQLDPKDAKRFRALAKSFDQSVASLLRATIRGALASYDAERKGKKISSKDLQAVMGIC